MRIIYLVHPISGDPANIAHLLEIVKCINLKYKDIVPFASYVADCLALDDTDPEQRARGLWNDRELFGRKFIQEIWVLGDTITSGMSSEIARAEVLGIPVTYWSEQDIENLLTI
jgi:hypothetical protein